MACVLQQGRTRPAPTPRPGQKAPKIQANFVRWSFSALGLVPRRAQRRVSLVFYPTLGFVLPPKLYRGADLEPGADLFRLGEEVFIKASTVNSLCPRWRGRAVILLSPSAFSSRLTVLKLVLCDDVMRHLRAIRCQFFRRD